MTKARRYEKSQENHHRTAEEKIEAALDNQWQRHFTASGAEMAVESEGRPVI